APAYTCPSTRERSCLVLVRRCKRSRCGFAGQSGSVPAQDSRAECRKRMMPRRQKRGAPARPLQELLLSTFARRVLNTAPFDPVLELLCPPPRFQERSAQSNPHHLLRNLLSPCGNRPTARPFRLRS